MVLRRTVAMTIAGSDSGGGAGIAADLKTFEAHGVWGTLALVAATAQNTLGVQGVATLAPPLVRAQIECVVSDIGVDAAKTGMLATAELVTTVAAAVRDLAITRLVVDPVLASTHGDTLLADDATGALREELLPLATVVTPNLGEAGRLVGFPVVDRVEMEAAARVLVGMGAGVALVTGGHLESDLSSDCLVERGAAEAVWLDGPRIATRHTHGSGCVLSAAIAAELARGMDPSDACIAAKRFVEKAIAAGLGLGHGIGPVDPGWAQRVG